MARGNDAEAAERELQTTYGDAPNAEEMIAQHRSAQDPRLHRANLSPIDQGATNALDLEKLKVGKDERVMSASVRGGYVVAVVEDARGDFKKRLMDLPKEAKAKSTIQTPVEGPKQAPSEPAPVGDGSEGEGEKETPPAAQPKSNPTSAK